MRSKSVLWFLASSFLVSCGGTQFQSKKEPAAESKVPSRGAASVAAKVLKISCEDEAKGSTTLGLGAGIVTRLEFEASCGSEETRVTSTTSAKPLDLVFVLDITGSMGGSLEVVKRNAVDFAKGLQAKGFDARFGAVGFRDSIDESIGFGDSKALTTALSSWRAFGGGAAPENGQAALRSALSIFEKASRPGADLVVLYVSDAPMYANPGTQADFSVQRLAADFRKFDRQIRLFCSVVNYDETPGETGFPSPSAQCDDLRKLSSKSGQNLPFPLSSSVLLGEFSSKIVSTTSLVGTKCDFQKVTLSKRDSLGVGVAENSEPWLSVDSKSDEPVDLSEHTLTIERRCGPSKGGNSVDSLRKVDFKK